MSLVKSPFDFRIKRSASREDSFSETSMVGEDLSNLNAIQPLHLLDPRTALNPEVTVNLTGGDYHTREFLASEKGHKYVKQFNPSLDSVKPLLEKMKEPSVLLLRGCDLLLHSPAAFPLARFKALTALEISGCTHLTILPERTISQMTRLRSLELSHLPINQLPDDLFSDLVNLRSLLVRGCSNLHSLPEPPQLNELECLDLSHLPVEAIPVGFMSPMLRSLILRGCSELRSLPPTTELFQLHLLDLFHCTSLQKLEPIETVRVLDLSFTAFGDPQFLISGGHLTHLFLRGVKVCSLKMFKDLKMSNLQVLDLSGAQKLENIIMLRTCAENLVALDLSRTAIQYTVYLPYIFNLRTLLLRECARLVRLEKVKNLQKLMVLDISGCEILADLPEDLGELRNLKELNLSRCSGLRELREGLFDQMSGLEKLDLSQTNFKNLPSFANLVNLRTLDLPDNKIDFVGVESHPSHLPGETSYPDEFHLVSTFITNTRFEQFRDAFTELNNYISNIEKSLKPTLSSDQISDPTTSTWRFDSMRADLQYILDNIDRLESSRNCASIEEILQELICFDCGRLDDYSTKLNHLLRLVVKLKLLVPISKQAIVEEDEKKEKTAVLLTDDEFEKQCYRNRYQLRKMMMDVVELTSPYESLTNLQRNCLLYFAGFPRLETEIKLIKESHLIHLWHGEGFFDPILKAKDPQPSPEMATTKGVENPNRIEEIGRQILQVLEEEGFIETLGGKKWHMDHMVYSFVREQAMAQHFFDFNKDEKLTPHIAVSGRACLLKSEDNCPSSSRVWLNYTKSSEKLQTFKTVHTLLYIDEPVVDIKTEWFSAMCNLSVLHLVNLWSTNEEQIDIVDLHFLEELKNMQQLRLLSLEGIPAIRKLPDSICKLTNLTILKLRYCTNLEELPAGIGSLVNLIYLDLTQCHLLSELPKGLSSLSKLEVLKGFIINYEVGGQQSRKACTLRELLKLQSLRKLNLVVVNKDSFPRTEDLRVFKEMKNLCSLNITWKENYDEVQEPQQKAVRHSRWPQLKCWKPQTVLRDETEEEEPLRSSNCFGNLEKLVLCCFRSETAPSWLRPSELQKLEKLYIVGGNLKTLSEDRTNQTTWKVKKLRLRYLSNLDMDWLILKGIFPDMRSFQIHECPHIRNR